MRILVTGGAGFVGANLALALAADGHEVVALDNLHRRGSELNLPRLEAAGVGFVRGDVRTPADLAGVGNVDALVECSAEPSALAGVDGSTDYVLQTNLVGAINCLDFARGCDAYLVFLSTSRVYPVAALDQVAYDETGTRYEIAPHQLQPGVSPAGISESFPLEGARTLYGSSKLCAELLIAEYAETFGVRAVIDRCGVIAGPWQMGKVDQGVFTHWMLSHVIGRELTYIGYGGSGKQVRDLLHIDDLVDLVSLQLADPATWAGVTANVGGGREISLSLKETTALCHEIAGRQVPVLHSAADRPGDVRIYLSDCERLFGLTGWRPRRDARQVLEDIHRWIVDNQQSVVAALG
jgi:CDP-paratose 2-epimerase